MAQVDAPIRAGLIFQQQELATRLRQTLVEAGITINAEFDVEALRTADLSAHEIEVYIVNLEPEIEDHLDEVTDLLEDALMPVVFNDAGVSSDLSGWDQARWARHLASKIRKGRGNLPPPPDNAEAIPTPKREVSTPVEAAAPIAEPVSESTQSDASVVDTTELPILAEPVEAPMAVADAAGDELGHLELELEDLTDAAPATVDEAPELDSVVAQDSNSTPELADIGSLDLSLEEEPVDSAHSMTGTGAVAEAADDLEHLELDLEDLTDAGPPAIDDAPAIDPDLAKGSDSTPALADMGSLELSLEDDPADSASSSITSATVAEPVGSMEFDSIDETDLESLDLLGDDDEGPAPASVGGDQAAYAAELAAGLVDPKSESPATDEMGEWMVDADAQVELSESELSWSLDPETESNDATAPESEPERSPLPDFGETSKAPALDDPQTLADLLGDGAGAETELSAFSETDVGIDELTADDMVDTLGDSMSLDADEASAGLEVAPAAGDDQADWQAGDSVLAEIETLSETDFDPPAQSQPSGFLDQDDGLDSLDLDFDVDPGQPAGEELVDLDALLEAGAADNSEADAAPELAPAPAEPPASAASETVASEGLDELAELPDLDSWSLEPLGDEEEPVPAPVSQTAPKPSETPTKRVKPVPEPSAGLADLSLSLDDLGLVPMDGDAAATDAGSTSTEAGDDHIGFNLGELSLEPETGAPEPAPASTPVPTPQPAAVAVPAAAAVATDGPRKIVILGASIGGPDSIRNFLSKLDTGLHGAFILVQHMGAEFLDLMAQQLDRVSPLSVNLARHGQQISEGEVIIAPVGQRLRIDADCKLDLSAEAGPTAYSPSIDQVLSDSLERWGAERLLVIIFSGMASDAVEGSKQLASAGTPIWAQDPASCVISSMVDGVVAAKVVNFIGSPEQLAEQANRLLA